MNVFLWILCEGSAHNVPSLYHLRQVQASLQKSTGVPTTQHKSPKGNVYSMNDPCTLVAMVRNIAITVSTLCTLRSNLYFILFRTGPILQYVIISITIR